MHKSETHKGEESNQQVEFPSLSMGNVYRNLNILIEQGLIGRIDFGSTFDRFDANIDPHYHCA
jgi:Fur family peroxide stress response transcriptional regulator